VKPPRRPAPPPLEANDRQVTVIGTAVWAGALVILLILRDQLAADQRWWIWTCVAGVCMGLFALWYVPRFKRARARKAQQRAAAQATGTAQAGAAGQAAGTEPPAEDPAIAPADAGTGGAVDGGTGGPVDGQPWSSDSKTVSSTETPG
jgi:Protein of unknown function (DUF2530)